MSLDVTAPPEAGNFNFFVSRSRKMTKSGSFPSQRKSLKVCEKLTEGGNWQILELLRFAYLQFPRANRQGLPFLISGS